MKIGNCFARGLSSSFKGGISGGWPWLLLVSSFEMFNFLSSVPLLAVFFYKSNS